MSEHAFLAPSAAHRWSVCPGSALMESRYPEQGDKTAAAEGEAAHWCAAQLFAGFAAETLLADGKTEAGHPVTAEMLEAAQMYVDNVRETLRPFAVIPIIERRVNIPRVHPTLNWGTRDAFAWAGYVAAQERFLYLFEFKFGHGYVDVFENKQMIEYACGSLSEANEYAQANNLPAWSEDHITVVMRIVQPRSYHRDGPIREWRVKATELRDHVFALSMAADEATGANPACRPQPAACENCNARHACEALQRAAYRGMDLAQQAQASDLSPAALGLELRYLTDAAKLMNARITGLQAQAESAIRQGGVVPHWTLAPSGSREIWNKPDAEVILMGELMGVSLAKSVEAITPTQARTAATKAGVSAEVFSAYSIRPSGAMKLTTDDGSAARKTFTQT